MTLPSPYLAFAFFCERALIESDGTLSVIRIVDKAIKQRLGEGKRNTPATLTLAIGLRSGEFQGSAGLTVNLRTPSGKLVEQPTSTAVKLNGGESAANVLIEVQLDLNETGVYLFDVAVEGNLLTRVPLTVVWSEPKSETSDRATPPSRS